MAMYNEMNDDQLVVACGTDAAKWAAAFAERWRTLKWKKHDPNTDVEIVIARRWQHFEAVATKYFALCINYKQ